MQVVFKIWLICVEMQYVNLESKKNVVKIDFERYWEKFIKYGVNLEVSFFVIKA